LLAAKVREDTAVTEEQSIFVTVGSTDFDTLVQTVDHLAPTLPSKGIMQIGHGRYVPSNWPHFRFADSLAPYYDRASLVIAHGGLATTMEVLARGLPLVSVSNPDRYDHHQDDLLSAMEEEGYLVWCRQLSELKQAIAAAQQGPLKLYERGACKIHLHIHEFLHALKKPR
jgi:beta-1,4-N-acetylglucosaminyltransferase